MAEFRSHDEVDFDEMRSRSPSPVPPLDILTPADTVAPMSKSVSPVRAESETLANFGKETLAGWPLSSRGRGRGISRRSTLIWEVENGH